LQEVVELTMGLTKIGSATYTLQKLGISFRRTLLYRTTESVSTDKLLVSHEAVRVLDRRE
jgi:hypothetical protein